jgi:hypothetical protein
VTSLQVEIGNAIADVLEATSVFPITFDTNTRRLFEEVDQQKECGTVIEISPLSSLFAPSDNLRGATAKVERTNWEWRAVVGFHKNVDVHAYEEALRPALVLVPETDEDFSPCRVELASVDATDPPRNAPSQDVFVDVRFNVFTQRG